MRVLLRSYQQQGAQRTSTDRRLTTVRLQIGRGTDQDLLIPDIRVALAHAEIAVEAQQPWLMAKDGHSVWLNGNLVESGKLAVGDEIIIGRFRIEVLNADADSDLALAIEERLSQRDDLDARKSAFRTSLRQTALRPRPIAWALAILVLACTLLIPLAQRYGGTTATAAPDALSAVHATISAVPGHHLLNDAIWLSGPISQVHAVIGQECAVCHVKPFQQVQDASCRSCHQDVGGHSDDPTALSHARFAEAKCTDCHREHNGAASIAARSPVMCADCHAQPQRDFADLNLDPASGFGTDHPEFAPRVAQYDAQLHRFSYDKRREPITALREERNLRFPHDLHLSDKGIDAPDGRRVMQCADCHQADAAATSFSPVRMEQHCASCHRLDFDPDDPQRLLPHGKPAQIEGIVRDYYANKALQGGVRDASAPAVVQARRRPGEVLDRDAARAAVEWAERRAQKTLSDVFERRTCHTCHQVSRSDDPSEPWAIAPVSMQDHALNHARFDHAAHRTETCGSCHAASHSKSSADLLLPDLASCRSCHSDANAAVGVPSSCTMCHQFHVTVKAPAVAGAAR